MIHPLGENRDVESKREQPEEDIMEEDVPFNLNESVELRRKRAAAAAERRMNAMASSETCK